MNKERIKQLRDHLASLPDERFDMKALYCDEDAPIYDHEGQVRTVIKDCGTAACIAGWAIALFKPHMKMKNTSSDIARDLLGLTEHQEIELFMPPQYRLPGFYTREQAIATLDRLLETGEVVW